MTQENKYKTTFTKGSLLLKEADALLYGENRADLSELEFHRIPVNSESSKKVLGDELVRRLKSINVEEFIPLFNAGSEQDKLLILFYAACKAYPLITDFMLDKVLDKWYNLDYELTTFDFKNFIYKQADTHPELENLTSNTISKLAQVTIRMLNELGMLRNDKLTKVDYNPSVLRAIAQAGDTWFLQAILLNDHEREEILH
ncbi:MAG: DUF1819 family protein [Bacteroidetes bacterium]|nr:DUF1819 family protein [Bacteroidota bacterium]